jgi:hypothetical protein
MKQVPNKPPKQLTLKDYIRYIPEDKTLQNHPYKNLASYIAASFAKAVAMCLIEHHEI